MNRQQQLLNSLALAGAVSALVATPARAEFAEVTAVRLNQTPRGIEIVLETKDGKPLQAFSASSGQTLITDIITTRLRLPGSDIFRADNPAPGIRSVQVTPLDANSIRVKVISETGVPTAQVLTRDGALVLSLSAAPGTTAVQPTPGRVPTTPSQEPGAVVPPAEPTQTPTQPGIVLPPVQPTQPSTQPGAVVPPGEPTPPGREPGAAIPPLQPTPPGREPGTAIPSEPATPGIQPPTEESIEVTVTGQRLSRYQVPSASAATRTNAPTRDIPQTIQVIPQQVLEDQGATQLSDALRNVPGVAPDNSSLTIFGDAFRSRGFSSGRDYFTNGVRNAFGGFNLNQETANIEQVEVLKGPASVLYGQGEPGGIINLTTKQPLRDPFYAVELTIGNFDFYRPTIDISGPLNADRTALYRLNAAYQNSNTFVDFLDLERYFVAPVVSLQIGQNTTLSFEGQYQRDNRLDYAGLPAVGTILPNPFGRVPISRYLGDPTREDQIRSVGSAGYRLEHRFSDNLRLRNSFRAELLTIDEDVIFTNSLLEDNRTVSRGAFRNNLDAQNYALQTDVIGTVTTGIVKQELLAGVELRRTDQNLELFNADVPSIDLFEPVYGIPPLSYTLSQRTFEQQNLVGVYLQNLISIGESVKILLGGRYDWVEQLTDNKITDESLSQEDTAFSPRVGIVYQPIEPVSLYASYSRSFAPSFSAGTRNADGTPFEPTTSQQFEVGVKTELLNGRLSTTLAAYQITKQNVITIDPERPQFSIQVGEQQSRGIEFNVVGQILPGFNIIAGYAFTDTEITKDNSGNEGNEFNNVPRHSGSLWATYEIQSGTFRGLGFGAGIFAVGDRKGDLANTIELPSYLRTDAAIYYRGDNWRAALNFKNLSNERYFESATFRDGIYPGAPLTIQGTFSVNF
ncbi:MAG TPA: TonB-dependent siderophore receptor [Cyanobacteria bacterium UBA8553]|nr:TonB-dependent siderophore receptor [Cyanobacteria bacterium UBA8553]